MGIQQILLGGAGGFTGDPSGITATGGTMYTGQKNDDGTPYTWHVFPGGPRGPESPMPYTFDVTTPHGLNETVTINAPDGLTSRHMWKVTYDKKTGPALEIIWNLNK